MALTPTKKYIDINGLGLYHEEHAPEMTYAEWQALPDSKYSDGREYHITDLTTSGVTINDSVISTNNVWSSSKVNTSLSGKADASALPILTSAVSVLTGATSCTITNANIHTSSLIEPFASAQGMAQPEMTITEGQCVLTFPALSADTSFKLRITN